MEALRTIQLDDAGHRRRLMIVAGTVVALGVGFIVVGELLGWDWTRILGAALITLGGAGFGVVAGLAEPRRQQMLAQLQAARLAVAVILALVLVLPAVLALGGAIVGVAGGGDQSLTLLLLGTLVGLLLLAATVASTVIALMGVRSAGQQQPQPDGTGEESA